MKWAFPEASDALDTMHGVYRTWRVAAALKQRDDGDGDGDGDAGQDAE